MRHPGKINTGLLSVLGALSFFLSAIEYMIPKPLPFIRLGFANLPLLLALDIMPFPSFIFLVGIKIAGQALVSGTLFSYVFLFSLGGTGISALLMYALRKFPGKDRISLVGVSAAGALASNGAQLILAWFFIFGKSVRYLASPVLALGTVTGTLLGITAEIFIRQSRWYRRYNNHLRQEAAPVTGAASSVSAEYAEKKEPAVIKQSERFRSARELWCMENITSRELAIAGLCMAPALLLNPDSKTRICQFVLFWCLAWLSGKKNNLLITVSVMLGIVFFNLLVPYGELLFAIGPVKITSGALWAGIHRAVTLEALIMLSRCCVRRDLSLPGLFGEVTGEALRFFAILTSEIKTIKQRNWIDRLDELLIKIENEKPKEKKTEPGKVLNSPGLHRSVIPGRIMLVAALILAWLPLLLRV